MQIGINDLDDDDFGMGFEPSNQESSNEESQVNQESSINEESSNQNDDEFLSDFLRTRGILE